MQNLGSAILFQALEKQHGSRFTIKEALTLCESNPIYRQGCEQNREIMARAIENTCSAFDAVREDIGDASYYEHAERINSGTAYIYQALRLIRDGDTVKEGKYPLFVVEPLFGSADLELQLQIEDNYNFDYRAEWFHYQQQIYVRGTPLREGSQGFLFKSTSSLQRLDENNQIISFWDDNTSHLYAGTNIVSLANAIAIDIYESLNDPTAHNTEIEGFAHPHLEGVDRRVELRILPAAATRVEQIQILRTLVREVLVLGDPDEEMLYNIQMAWIDVDTTRIELSYNFYIGRYLASNGDEPDRANLNLKMLECFSEEVDCPTTYGYWSPLFYEFLGSPNLAYDDFWWETEVLKRAAQSINLYMWAERLIAQRKAFGNNMDWLAYVKALLTGRVGRYIVVVPERNVYMGDQMYVQAFPNINDRYYRRGIKFDVYGSQPVGGKTGLVLDYAIDRDFSEEDGLYKTGYLDDGNTLLFLGPDEPSTMLMVLKYCCLIHYRTMISSWVDEENHPHNPWDDENLETTENYEWDEPHSGKKMPTLEGLVATQNLRLGINEWDLNIYNGEKLIFSARNVFKLYRVRF
jgi:hypothetical protein